jgi:hypothetical protein
VTIGSGARFGKARGNKAIRPVRYNSSWFRPSMPSMYLAGPEVSHAQRQRIVAERRSLCAAPIDAGIHATVAAGPGPAARWSK